MKNTKLRIVWIFPNVFSYIMLIGFSIFVIINKDGLEEMNRLSISIFLMILLFFASIYGSYRIWTWMKEGKM